MDPEHLPIIPYAKKIGKKNLQTDMKEIKTKKTTPKRKTFKPVKKTKKNIIDKFEEIITNKEKNEAWSKEPSVTPRYWEVPNRKSFSGWLDKEFEKYRIKSQSQTYEEQAHQNINVELFIHQKFLKDYLQANSPYRGLLLYHGLGSGKTCSSISISEGLKQHYKVFILTPKSLQLNFKKELKKCGSVLYQINQFWEFIDIDISNKEELSYIETEYNVPKKQIKKQNGLWINYMDRESNFKLLTDEQQQEINEQVKLQIESQYNFIAYNGMRISRLTKWVEEEGNPFDNTLVVVDEAHNLVSRIVNNRPIGKLLYKLLQEAENMKLVLLTGTPIINYPHEISIIANILRGYIKQYTFKISRTDNKNIDIEELTNFFTSEKTIDQFFINHRIKTVQFTRNKQQFSNYYLTGNYKGVFKYNNELDELEWLNELEESLKSIKYKLGNKKIELFQALPDKKEEFHKFFIENGRVKNEILFKKRIAGLVSYYSGQSSELYPSSTEYLVPIPLSDYQFNKYEEGRKKERDLEINKRGKKNDDDMSSYYRVFSRMIGNFVFPESIERTFGDKKIELEDDPNKDDSMTDESENKNDDYKIKIWKKLYKFKDKYLGLESLDTFSPKFKMIIENINMSGGNVFVYSQFKTLEGINTLGLALNVNGYAKFILEQDSSGDYVQVLEHESDRDLPKYAIFEGEELMKDYLLKIYNNDLENLPSKLQKSLINKSNLRGEIVKVLFATSTGAEGLDLANVRQVHITEPYWNPVRLQQVMGRGVRYRSHENLPPDERHVDIYTYISVFTTEQMENASVALKTRDTNPIIELTDEDIGLPVVFNPLEYPCFTSDQSIYYIAHKKKTITNDFFQLLKEAAVDCNLNALQNEEINCFNYNSNVNNQDYSFTPNISEDEGSAYIQAQQKEIITTGKPISYKGKKYILSDDGLVYDYECWKGFDGKGARPVIVGNTYLNEKNNKTQIKLYD